MAQAATPVVELLPANTPAALVVETEQTTWDQLLQYELFSRMADAVGQPLSPGSLPFLLDGLDYKADIAPWLGDGIAIALLPIPSAATVAPQERGYVVLSVEDAEAVPGFIDALAEVYQQDPVVSAYKGVPIYDWPEPLERTLPFRNALPGLSSLLPDRPLPDFDIELPSGSSVINGLAVAVFDDHVVMGLNLSTLRYWVEYQQRRGPRLTENADFLTLKADADAKGALGLAYGNIGELAKFTIDAPFQVLSPLPLPEPTLRERAQTAALFRQVTFEAVVYPQRHGLHVEARVNDSDFLLPLPRGTVDGDDQTILSHLPASTYLLGSGYDLSGLWTTISATIDRVEIGRSLLNTARLFIRFSTGLDLDREILGWMDSEYTLFFFPSRSGLLNSFVPEIGVEAGVLLQTTNRSTAETALDAIDGLVGPNVAMSRELRGTPVRSWELDLAGRGFSQSVLSHTWLTDDTLAITTGTGAMERLVSPVAFESLTEHSTFKNATEIFPQPNFGYFYVNAAPTLATLYHILGLDPTDPFIQTVKGGLGTVRSLSVTTSSTAEAVQLDALLGLARTSRPQQEPRPLQAQ